MAELSHRSCTLYAGEKHDKYPPEAVASVRLQYLSLFGEVHITPADLCHSCLASKISEWERMARAGRSAEISFNWVATGYKFPPVIGRWGTTVPKKNGAVHPPEMTSEEWDAWEEEH